jgi:biopolymer transport protein TolQ
MQLILGAASDETLWTLVTRTVSESGGIEKGVFFLLAALSVVSWCIVILKLADLNAARRGGERFLLLFDSAENFGEIMTAAHSVGRSPQLTIFKAGLGALEKRVSTPAVNSTATHSVSDARQIQLRPGRAAEDLLLLEMQDAAQFEFSRLQRGLGFLATIGATTPFIGLFGTVWGIMDTFRALGSAESASLRVVGPGISSALIATAAGLAVAIPAVMAYNWLLGQIDELQDQGDSFIERMRVLVLASGYLKHGEQPAALPLRARPLPPPPPGGTGALLAESQAAQS